MSGEDSQLYMPEVLCENSYYFRKVCEDNEKQYLIEYDRDGTYGKIVEKYKNKGNEVLVIDYFNTPISKSEIENIELVKSQQSQFNFLGSIEPTFCDILSARIYKDVPYMKMDEIEQKRKYLNVMRTNYLNDVVKYHPCVYTVKQENCKKSFFVDEVQYYIDLTTNNIVQLHKFDGDNMIVIDYFAKPLLMDHILAFKQNDCYLLSWPFSDNTLKTLGKYANEFLEAVSMNQIVQKRIFLNTLTQ